MTGQKLSICLYVCLTVCLCVNGESQIITTAGMLYSYRLVILHGIKLILY